MRRFWLLLIAFVLPLQMSWAAAHFCDEEKLVTHAVAAAEHGGHAHADGQSDAKSEKIADACCSAAHGCHGCHQIMGPAGLAFAPSVAKQMPAPSGASPPLGGINGRIERPNWLAA